MADEEGDGVGLPQKGLNMIIKDALPDMRIANETRELMNQCCVEFIKHVSREAQLISSKDQRKTIYHDHVQKALKNLGFPRDYVEAANSVLGECKIAAEKRLKRKNSRLDKCGIPEEQLWQMQQRLIEQARRNEAEKQQATLGQFAVDGDNAASFGGAQQLPQEFVQQFCHQQKQFIPLVQSHQTAQQTDGPASLPAMMPFGLTPEQLIVPSTAPMPMDPNLAAVTHQLLFMQQGSSSCGTVGGNEDDTKKQSGREEDEEEDYDV